jgi:hypothetical protein
VDRASAHIFSYTFQKCSNASGSVPSHGSAKFLFIPFSFIEEKGTEKGTP